MTLALLHSITIPVQPGFFTPEIESNMTDPRESGNFQAARRTIQGYEAIHMMRKGQVRWVSGTDIRRQNQFINNVFELAA